MSASRILAVVVWARRARRCGSLGSWKRAIWSRPSSLARYIAWSAATRTASGPTSRLPPNIVTPTLIVAGWAAPPRSSRDLGAQVLAQLQRPRGVGLRHQHRELIAGEAGDDVGGAHPLAHGRGDAADQAVAGVVAVSVVDRLEAVDVDDHHRPLAAVAGAEGDVLVELGAEAAAVEQAGQRVVVGEVAQLGLGPLGLGQRRRATISRSSGSSFASTASIAGALWESESLVSH